MNPSFLNVPYIHNTVNQTGALSSFLGGKEGLKDMIENTSVDPISVIAHVPA
jgi:hypothetical protein